MLLLPFWTIKHKVGCCTYMTFSLFLALIDQNVSTGKLKKLFKKQYKRVCICMSWSKPSSRIKCRRKKEQSVFLGYGMHVLMIWANLFFVLLASFWVTAKHYRCYSLMMALVLLMDVCFRIACDEIVFWVSTVDLFSLLMLTDVSFWPRLPRPSKGGIQMWIQVVRSVGWTIYSSGGYGAKILPLKFN